MKVIICEDQYKQRRSLQNIIMHCAFANDLDIEVVLCAEGPEQVIDYLAKERANCYFLDIELNAAQNGLELAQIIRNKDPLATIIFVTTFADKLKLTFTYKIAALDFIVKDEHNFTKNVLVSLMTAYDKYTQISEGEEVQYFPLKIGELTRKIRFEDIYYFETSPNAHKVILKEKNGFYEFYGNLKDIEQQLDNRFFRCHRSYIINLQHIEQIDKKNKFVIMKNGLKCEVAFKKKKMLQEHYLNSVK